MSDTKQEQINAAKLKADGMTRAQIASKLGLTARQVKSRLAAASRDPAIQTAMNHVGTGMEPSMVWIKDECYSVQLKPTKADDATWIDTITDSLSDYKPLDKRLFAPRVNHNVKGEHLLVLDLADVHFGKLCDTSETGNEYNVEVARHRAIEGTRALLRGAEPHGVGRVLFVMGNDILHTEDGRSTTSGTPQDHDGTFFTAWRAALQASMDVISECRAVADVDMVHCSSNHDWRQGWALSQAIAAGVSGLDGVRATDYNMSEAHRKYYGFGRNAIGLTHGDGAKEEKLYALMVTEARELIVNGCDLFYWYCHHLHHKISKRRGVDVFQSEKDHTGNMTAITLGLPSMESGASKIEYVRSPSAPDGWHHRNGYLNRQAVEAFLHHPTEGQKHRLTEWF